jgi:two-component system response regulator CpxR
MEKYRVLIIDDDVELCGLLSEYLGSEEYETASVHNGIEGADTALAEDFDLIILDIMLPGKGGLDVLKAVRREKTTPVLMLTAKGDDIDRILGLELGADDYLPKPYNPRELLARIKAILRRTSPSQTQSAKPETISAGGFTLNTGKLSAIYKERMLDLTSAEYCLLEMLALNAGTVVTREDIARHVLGRELSSFDRSIDVHISNIRKKAGDTGVIKSIRGTGYQLIAGGD